MDEVDHLDLGQMEFNKFIEVILQAMPYLLILRSIFFYLQDPQYS
jgi:hypothetical protein